MGVEYNLFLLIFSTAPKEMKSEIDDLGYRDIRNDVVGWQFISEYVKI